MGISKSHGYGSLADEMKKAKMGKPLSEKFERLEEDYRKKNKPSFDETFEAAKQKAREYNEQNKNAPKINRERKDHGEVL